MILSKYTQFPYQLQEGVGFVLTSRLTSGVEKGLGRHLLTMPAENLVPYIKVKKGFKRISHCRSSDVFIAGLGEFHVL